MSTPKQSAANRQTACKPTGSEAGLASCGSQYLIYFLSIGHKIGFVWYFCYLALLPRSGHHSLDALDIHVSIPVEI